MTSYTKRRRTAALPRLFAAGAALMAGVLLTPQAHAQGQPRGGARSEQRMDPAQRLERQVAFLTERLRLTSEQAARVRQILLQEREQMQALRQRADAQSGSSRESLREEVRAIRERTVQQIEGVLTEQQRSTYRELREAQRRERPESGQRRPRGDRPRAGTA